MGSVFPTLPGSVTKSIPGYDVRIFDEENNEVDNSVMGKVVIKMPMPPSFMLTVWGNDEAFVEKYLTETPGYYTTGDAGMKDEQGYLHIMTRMDDVINTAGHRISTGLLEEVVNKHPLVVESAVVAFNDEIRGETPLAFVVTRGNESDYTLEQRAACAKEVNAKVREDVGAFCKLSGIIFIKQLPKTRSGKILRGVMKKIVADQEYKAPATIEDESVLDLVKEKKNEWLDSLPKE